MTDHSALRRWAFCCAVLGVAVMGCASKPPAHTVGGSVTFGGRPLLSGVIRFAPDDPQATPAAANVTDGRYTLTGVRPGKYTVTVEASAAVPVAGAETTSGTKAVVAPLPSIPPKYRTGVAVEVVADNPNLDFDLSK